MVQAQEIDVTMIILSVAMQEETCPHGLTDTKKALNKILTAVPDSFSSLSHTHTHIHTHRNAHRLKSEKKHLLSSPKKHENPTINIVIQHLDVLGKATEYEKSKYIHMYEKDQ